MFDREVLEALQRLLDAGGKLQPNSGPCFVCGLENRFGLRMRFVQVAPDRAVTYVKVPRRFQGYPGIVHGGITASILDEAAGRAMMGVDPDRTRLAYTARLTLRYRQQVPVEQLLRAEGWVVRDRGRSLLAQAALYRGDEQDPLVEAEALLVVLPPQELARLDREALGWRIYDLRAYPVAPAPQPCLEEG